MRVVPSVLVNFMDTNLHAIAPASQAANGFRGVPYDHGYAPLVRAFIDLFDDLPEELLYALSETEMARLQIARNEILAALVAWERGESTPTIAAARFVAGNPHLLVLIRDLLDKCPDQVPSTTTTKLAFIADVSFREHLRADIDSVARALHSGDWKTATIMAGSVIEALLLWSVDAAEARAPGSYGTRKASLDPVRRAAGRQALKSDTNKLVLDELIEIVGGWSEVGFRPNTLTNLHAVREYRNAIHPGVVQRTGFRSTRGTAHVAFGAIDLIVEDLERWRSTFP